MINLKNILVELEFKTPAEFAAYKKKHKMRPGTVVKVAGKDKVVDAPKGKKTKTSGIEFSTFGKKDIKRFTCFQTKLERSIEEKKKDKHRGR